MEDLPFCACDDPMTSLTIHTYGPRAVLLEWNDDDTSIGDAPLRFSEWARRDDTLSGLAEEIVPGARTVLVVHRPGVGDDVRRVAASFDPASSSLRSGRQHEIPVNYDGEDLAAVAAMIGSSVADVVAMHSAATYRVAFCGFAPGFGYLTGLDSRLHVPRRETPRTKVPAGSVAIASEYSAVYPHSSPGGWHLLGTTTTAMWDVERMPPSLLQPGDTVRFIVNTCQVNSVPVNEAGGKEDR
jgi:KipI family sensor histidine kinase inhibitor